MRKKPITHLILSILIISTLSACGGAANSVSTQLAPEEPSPQTNYQDLGFDEFLEISYRDIRLRTPESYVGLGLESVYEIKTTELNNISDEYLEDTYQLYQLCLETLQSYDRAQLSQNQQTSYDLYQAWLQDFLDSYPFRYHNYLETGYFLKSVTQSTEFFFSDTHPMNNVQDAKDYLVRLELVDEKIELLIESLKTREEKGLIPPQILVSGALDHVNGTAVSRPTWTVYYTAYQNKLGELDLDDSLEEELLDQAELLIETSILPAYESLAEVLSELVLIAPTQDGVWQYEQGNEYYEYLLSHHTTTALTAQEIHEIGLQELERIHIEMQALFDELGYPAGESRQAYYRMVVSDSGSLSGSEIYDEFKKIIANAEEKISPAFDRIPQQQVEVIGGKIGGFYLRGSLDSSRPGAFYAATSGTRSWYTMPTLAYHEAIPGHHFQIALAQEMDFPTFRKIEFDTAYVEGWALYAERLAYELGWYESDLYGDLGRLQFEAFRAARLVVDTGIHAFGWTFNEAAAFFAENTGFSTGYAQGQIFRYTANPGQATSYMIGMLKILELRQIAQDRLGEQFALPEFHDVILSSGSLPLDMLEEKILEYIDSKSAE